MPSFAYGGHRRPPPAPRAAPAARFVAFPTPAESPGRPRRWSWGRGHSSSVTPGDGAGSGATRSGGGLPLSPNVRTPRSPRPGGLLEQACHAERGSSVLPACPPLPAHPAGWDPFTCAERVGPGLLSPRGPPQGVGVSEDSPGSLGALKWKMAACWSGVWWVHVAGEWPAPPGELEGQQRGRPRAGQVHLHI